jgi:carboxymethylenebutenolidase
MGEMVEFPSNGERASGYLAVPSSGSGPGIVVIQEWWGLVPHIKDICDRFAGEGFAALAVDLYHGEIAREPDEAGKKLMALQLPRAVKEMSGAVQWLLQSDVATGDGVGVVGFCAGGGLALLLATAQPEVHACVAYYPAMPWPGFDPDYSKLNGPVLGHFAEKDPSTPRAKVVALEELMRAGGQHVEFHWYPNTTHAFFNDARPEVYDPDAARLSWDRTLAFFRQHLGVD